MTINQLHKLTAKLKDQGLGRRVVHIDKSTFSHPLESDGCLVLEVETADMHTFNILDDDGFTAVNAKGAEVYYTGLVLYGNDRKPEAAK